jgi:glutathione-regulated potassium-efflux system ancillary protein KefG
VTTYPDALDSLIDAGEVAAILGLAHRNSVSTYRSRYPSFPPGRPAPGGGRSRLWTREEIVLWHQAFRARQSDSTDEPSARLEALVDATTRLLLASPGTDISIRQIAAEAGVAHSDLYRYADSKDQLIDLAVASVEARMRTAIPEDYDVFVDALPEILTQSRAARASMLVLTERALRRESASTSETESINAIAELIAREREASQGSSAVDPRVLAACVGAMHWGLLVMEDRWLTGLGLGELPEDQVAAVIRAMLKA